MKRLSMISIVLAACGHQAVGGGAGGITITSSAFAAHTEIPKVYTCEGDDVAPPLAWTGAPAATKSYALIMDDPDAPDPAAPKKTHIHWVLVNIPATVTSLPAGAGLTPPDGAANGTNDDHNTRWNGPCPRIGRHRYFFKLYALDAANLGRPAMTKADLLEAIEHHVLAKGELVGTYQKNP